MPPFELWLQGPVEIGHWYLGQGVACGGSRLVATSANGCPAFASYKPADDGGWEPFNLHIVEVSDGRISGLHHFLYPELFPAFGLPPRLEHSTSVSPTRSISSECSGRVTESD